MSNVLHLTKADLTEREYDILLLLAAGLSNSEIAERLMVELSTVKWYNRQIYNKLGAENRREAVQTAEQLGLLNAPQPIKARPRHNLPAQTTPFVGREHELDELSRLLVDPEIRLITILAPGGMGKTRLALEVAGHFTYEHGVWFVDLSPLRDAALIPAAVAMAVGFTFFNDERTPEQQLLDYLREKSMLLVLDNFEHLLDAAVFLDDVLRTAPDIKLLVTSRERMNLQAETLFRIEGIVFPDWETPEDMLEYAAVKLFMQSARRVQRNFELLSDDLMYIARICRLVEGMPLAILLAAAWLDSLTIAEIADEISQSMDILETNARDLPARQRSIRAVFDPTWMLLSPAEQQVFMKLALFQGGFTREAAQAVAEADLRTLVKLVDKALIAHSPSGRYTIHEVLRQYGEEKLDAAELTDVNRKAHSQYFAGFMQQQEGDIQRHRQMDVLNEIRADLDNVLEGLRYAVSTHEFTTAQQYVETLGYYYLLQDQHHEGVRLFEGIHHPALLTSVDDARTFAARALAWHGAFLVTLWQSERAMALLTQAQALDPNNVCHVAFCLVRSPVSQASSADELHQARLQLEEALHIYEGLGDQPNVAFALHRLGLIAFYEGRVSEFEDFSRRAARIWQSIGNRARLATALVNVSGGPVLAGRYEEAEAIIREGLASARELHKPNTIGFHLRNLVAVKLALHQLDQADMLITEGTLLSREYHLNFHLEAFLFQRSLWYLLQSDYTHALQAAQDTQTIGLEGQPHEAHYPMAGTGCALCGLGDYAGAHDYLFKALPWVMKDVPAAIVAYRLCASGIAAVQAYQGESLRAVELVSALAIDPLTPDWWLTDEPLTCKLIAELRRTLDSDTYAAAWERGKAQDHFTLLQALLIEYSV